MLKLENTKLTWSFGKLNEDKNDSLWKAVCEETGKTFINASTAQLVSHVQGYESYAKDVVGIYMNMSKIQTKLGRTH